MDKLGLKDFILRIFSYSKYAKERIDKLEAENEVFKAQLEAIKTQEFNDAIYIEYCCYPDCEFWFIDGESSDLNRGMNLKGVITCYLCFDLCCGECAEKHGWGFPTEKGLVEVEREIGCTREVACKALLCPSCNR